jgi:hypothetical protein
VRESSSRTSMKWTIQWSRRKRLSYASNSLLRKQQRGKLSRRHKVWKLRRTTRHSKSPLNPPPVDPAGRLTPTSRSSTSTRRTFDLPKRYNNKSLGLSRIRDEDKWC